MDGLSSALLPAAALTNRGYRSFVVFAQLQNRATAAQAESTLAGIAASLQSVDPEAWTDARGQVRKVTVVGERSARFSGSPGALPVMLGGAGAAIAGVLALACINVATLLLARGASRTRELTIRLAIGASRSRIARQLAVESLLMAAAGFATAAGLVVIGIRLAGAYYPAGAPAVNLAFDWRVSVFAAIAAVLSSLLFGLAPGLHILKLAIADGLKGRTVVLRRRWIAVGAREILILVQVTASVALLLAAGLFADALRRGATASPGFQTSGITIVQAEFSSIDKRRAATLANTLLDAARRNPGVISAGAGGLLLLTGSSMTTEAQDDSGRSLELEANVVSPGYFATLGIPLRQGRDFSDSDRPQARRVAIASETLARSIWNTTDVIGKTLRLRGRPVEIVGVAADTRYRAIAEPFQPVVYVPFAQSERQRFILYARVTGGSEAVGALDRTVRAIDPAILIDGPVALASRMDEMRAGERAARGAGIAAGLSQLALSLMALWALMAYAVERRRFELGVRLALGATGGSVIRLIARPAILLIAAGSIAGTALGVVTAWVMESSFTGLNPLNPLVGLPIAALMAVVALAAAWLPAKRAARVDPIAALRAE
jgi:predicted permease